jgi:general secretion pathway protein M
MSALPPFSNASNAAPATLGALLRQRWAALSERDRVIVGALALVLAALVVWLAAIRPAMHTLAMAPAQRAQVDAQALQLQAIASEAVQLRQLAPVPQAQAEQVLKSATEQLGAAKARLQMQGGRATLALTNVNGEELRQWLVQARGGARARPSELQITRGEAGFSGTLVVTYGAQP